jgi:imidazole glycerol-phosphate synthase subunit HisH
MSRIEIAIVDYQMGNLRSVQKALERVGAEATITNDPNQIAEARKVILPGVGAFGDAMRELNARNLPESIVDSIRSGKPFLGICLGLQLLFETGFEGERHPGLGVIAGEVVRFSHIPDRKVPHMGWNQVRAEKANCQLLDGISSDAYFYFVHSYYVQPADTSAVWLSCDYGQQFCASIWRDNLFATQFHPEKSQRDGLKLLENFAAL